MFIATTAKLKVPLCRSEIFRRRREQGIGNMTLRWSLRKFLGPLSINIPSLWDSGVSWRCLILWAFRSLRETAAVALLLTGLALAPHHGGRVFGQSVPHASDASFPVVIRVDALQTKGEFHPVWRFFGADEPNFAYMKDGKKLLAELGQLRPRAVYFRAHNLLTSGDGMPAFKWGSTNAYHEDANGNPVYDWTILDGIFDSYLQRGVRPYVQIGFMPKDLSIKPEPYQHKWTPRARYDEIYTGWAYPPKDYRKWAELVFQWTKHGVEKHGRAEVETWFWEVWNE